MSTPKRPARMSTPKRPARMSTPKYPEHEKLKTLEGKDAVTAFLEFLGEHGYTICVHDEEDSLERRGVVYYPAARMTIEDWLAMYFGIDRKKLSAEKDAMYAELVTIANSAKGA